VSASPVGVNAKCGIPRLNHDGSISNVANIAACGVSVFFVALLIVLFLHPLSFSSFPLVFLLSSISSTSITPPPSSETDRL
ncbi:hypothetical protein DFP72DRAFT_909799, partial [Ephemerocybe angulata]